MASQAQTYHLIGLMSGSSLDGLDIAYCQFNHIDGQWHFTLLQSKTAALGIWENKLKQAIHLSEEDLALLSEEFAGYLAQEVNLFIEEFSIERMDAVVSHGHTIYHYPEKGITCQIGDGQILASLINLPVINNLRQKDILLGGQGAPIVPIGDLYLFKDYRYCLNIGGIANISVKTASSMVAFDICAANQVLNYYAKKLELAYDDEGSIARNGKLNEPLLERLNKLEFYNISAPKSLDNGFSKEVIQLIDANELPVEDCLRTYVEQIAVQVIAAIDRSASEYDLSVLENERLYITGGGAFNTFLVERIKAKLRMKVLVPDKELVDYKEAIVMAFIGVLKLRNEANVLASVTGAKMDSCCGDYFIPISN